MAAHLRTVACLVAAAAAFACQRPFSVKIAECPHDDAGWKTTDPSRLQLQYLGVGGFLLRRGADVVLTAPLFSNPSIVEIVADHRIASDEPLIEELLPPEADPALAILVGHSHYDHLMDVPYVALRRATAARIVGNTTVGSLLASWPALPPRITCVDETAAGCERPGTWFTPDPKRAVRVMALPSEHSVQVTLKLPGGQKMPLHLWRGEAAASVPGPPRSASDWVEGRVFAYLVDFLDAAGRPAFRVYYQDSGASFPKGAAPAAVIAEKRVDVALLCVGGDFHRLDGHPERLVDRLRPRVVVLGHWEDFFVTQDQQRRDGRFTVIPDAGLLEEGRTAEFVRRAGSALRAVDPAGKVFLPCPRESRFVITPE